MTNLNPIKKKPLKVDRKISLQESSKTLAEFFNGINKPDFSYLAYLLGHFFSWYWNLRFSKNSEKNKKQISNS